jgi:hypothetical protein
MNGYMTVAATFAVATTLEAGAFLGLHPGQGRNDDDFGHRVNAACRAPYRITDWMARNDHGQKLDGYVTVTCRKLGKYNITLDEYQVMVRR